MAIRGHYGVTEDDLKPGPYVTLPVDQVQELQSQLVESREENREIEREWDRRMDRVLDKLWKVQRALASAQSVIAMKDGTIAILRRQVMRNRAELAELAETIADLKRQLAEGGRAR